MRPRLLAAAARVPGRGPGTATVLVAGLTSVLVAVLAGGCAAGGSGGPAAVARTGTTAPAASAASGTPSPSSPPGLRVGRLGGRLPQPLAREGAVLQPDGRHLLVAGGLLAGDSSTAASFLLDLRTGRTRPGPALGIAVHDTAAALLGGTPTVFGGGNATEQDAVQQLAGGSWRVVGRLPSARSDLAVVGDGAHVYAVGGYDGAAPAQAELLSSVDGVHWRGVATLPDPVRYPGAVLLGRTVWVFGGERSGTRTASVQRIDLGTGRARVVARLPEPLSQEAAVGLGGRILLAGGRGSGGEPTDRMWWFDPTTLGFTRAGRLPTPLADAAVAPVGADTAYLVGGETPALSDRVLRLTWG